MSSHFCFRLGLLNKEVYKLGQPYCLLFPSTSSLPQAGSLSLPTHRTQRPAVPAVYSIPTAWNATTVPNSIHPHSLIQTPSLTLAFDLAVFHWSLFVPSLTIAHITHSALNPIWNIYVFITWVPGRWGTTTFAFLKFPSVSSNAECVCTISTCFMHQDNLSCESHGIPEHSLFQSVWLSQLQDSDDFEILPSKGC